jgi:hypothetical protein
MLNEVDSLQQLLGSDLSGVSTAMPVLEPNTYDFTIAKMEVVDNKAKNGKVLVISLTLATGAKAFETGKVINPGFPLITRMGLAETEKYTAEDIQRNLATLKEAILGDKSGSFLPLEQYYGKTVTARTKVESSADYGNQTVIARFIKKKV